MFRSYQKRLIEPVESLSDLAGALLGSPAMDRTITKATLSQMLSIKADAASAGWPDIEKYSEAYTLIAQGIEKMKAERDELTNSWLVGVILHPAQRLALEGQRLVVSLAEQEGARRVQ